MADRVYICQYCTTEHHSVSALLACEMADLDERPRD